MGITPINYIEIHNDSAIVAGTGIKIANIAAMYVHLHTPVDWIAENYGLTPAQIHAALSYYYDHREEIDREIQEGDDLAKQIGIPSSEALARMRERQKRK